MRSLSPGSNNYRPALTISRDRSGLVFSKRDEMPTPWNHNIHYHDLLLRAVPSSCARALDVGCGQGLLATQLASRCATVVGIDLDLPMTTLPITTCTRTHRPRPTSPSSKPTS